MVLHFVHFFREPARLHGAGDDLRCVGVRRFEDDHHFADAIRARARHHHEEDAVREMRDVAAVLLRKSLWQAQEPLRHFANDESTPTQYPWR